MLINFDYYMLFFDEGKIIGVTRCKSYTNFDISNIL